MCEVTRLLARHCVGSQSGSPLLTGTHAKTQHWPMLIQSFSHCHQWGRQVVRHRCELFEAAMVCAQMRQTRRCTARFGDRRA
eukprot:7036567-Prymnesium_polylepis.2